MNQLNLDSLNPKQREVVLALNGPLLILSGAGSGKTRVIAYRIAYMVSQNIPSYNILAITFTNKAAKEMRERVNNLLGFNEVFISTFHSLCVRILRSHAEKLGFSSSFTIYDTQDSERLLKDCIKELDLSEKTYAAKSVLTYIGNLKDQLMTPREWLNQADTLREKAIARIYTLYQQRMKENSALDFDDIIIKTLELFWQDEDTLEYYQNRFKYIMVDEYQDTNLSQYTLVNLLARAHENLCVVGDDDQSIYSFRGANIRNILDFEKDFPGAKVIKLEENYRSTQNILNAANSVIQNNLRRKDKSLWTKKNPGTKLTYVPTKNEREEASFVAQTIKQEKNYKDIAVLYRQNSLARSIEDHLIIENIPYKVFGGLRFYDRKEIKDILAYLKILNNPRDNISLKRIINVPKRGIGDVTVERLSNYAAEKGVNLYDLLQNIESADINIKSQKITAFVDMMENFKTCEKVSELIRDIMDKTRYAEEIDGDEIEKQSRLDNINELINKAVEYEHTDPEPTLKGFLEEVALVADIDNYNESDDYVSLMTIHSSKGLEFPLVFLIGFEEGVFPRANKEPHELEEERRLCYVAITRAGNTMYLTTSAARMIDGKTRDVSPSRFLQEIDQSLIEVQRNRGVVPKNKGISQYAEIKRFNDEKGPKAVGKSYKNLLLVPKNKVLDFTIGDTVKQSRYGEGVVTDITPAGADYEITVKFPTGNSKKFMAFLSKLKKV